MIDNFTIFMSNKVLDQYIKFCNRFRILKFIHELGTLVDVNIVLAVGVDPTKRKQQIREANKIFI